MNPAPLDDSPTAAPPDITGLLRQWRAGDSGAFDRLMPIVYDRMRHLARARLRAEGVACSLNTTDLVHEAYLKLVDSPGPSLRRHGRLPDECWGEVWQARLAATTARARALLAETRVARAA